MIGHLGLNVTDLNAARSSWHELASPMGMIPYLDEPDFFSFRPGTNPPRFTIEVVRHRGTRGDGRRTEGEP